MAKRTFAAVVAWCAKTICMLMLNCNKACVVIDWLYVDTFEWLSEKCGELLDRSKQKRTKIVSPIVYVTEPWLLKETHGTRIIEPFRQCLKQRVEDFCGIVVHAL